MDLHAGGPSCLRGAAFVQLLDNLVVDVGDLAALEVAVEDFEEGIPVFGAGFESNPGFGAGGAVFPSGFVADKVEIHALLYAVLTDTGPSD